MDVNGENTDKRWRKETHVLVLIIGVPWPLVVQFANKYVNYFKFFTMFVSIFPFSNKRKYKLQKIFEFGVHKLNQKCLLFCRYNVARKTGPY